MIFCSCLTAQSASETAYNAAQRRTRGIVERTFGIWKRRFPVLHFGIRTQMTTTMAMIPALAVLHNISVDRNDPLPPPLDPQDLNYDVPVINAAQRNVRGETIRRQLIARHF